MKESSASAYARSSGDLPGTRPPGAPPPETDAARLVDAVQRLFRTVPGHVPMRLWDGRTLHLGRQPAPNDGPRFTLVVHTPQVLRSLLGGGDPLRLADAYF